MRRIDFTNTQVASSETARDINRSVVLNLIRRRQPISRADLARASGLQRSTVSLITEQLIEESWVINGPMGRLPRGRRPTFLRLNEKRAILVADIRPHQTTVALGDVNGRFLSQIAFPTTSDGPADAANIGRQIRQLMQSHPKLIFEGVGHGEHVRDMVVVTVSEGIGTGIFLNGQLMRGTLGMAGEFGHVALDPAGPKCTCGGNGCWEVFASNRAALRYYQSSASGSSDLSFQDLLSLANAGDALAVESLEKMAKALGRGMRMLVAGLAPTEIVVVGECTSQWHRFGPIVEAEVAAGVRFGKPPRIRAAEGHTARLRGTVALVLQKHFGASANSLETQKSGALAV